MQSESCRIQSFSKFEIGAYDEDENLLIKHYPRIFVYDRLLEISQVIKAKKMKLQYGGKYLIYSDENILIFKGISYLKLSNSSLENENIRSKFINHLESLYK